MSCVMVLCDLVEYKYCSKCNPVSNILLVAEYFRESLLHTIWTFLTVGDPDKQWSVGTAVGLVGASVGAADGLADGAHW